MQSSVRRPCVAVVTVAMVVAAAPAASAGTARVTQLTAHAFWPTVTTRSVIAVTGMALPEVRGLPVRLQREVAGHWVTVGAQPVALSGRYSFRLSAPGRPATWRLRVVRSAATNVEAAVSPTFLQSVTAAPEGTVRAWGDNRFATLGNGSRVSTTKPVTVPGLSHVVSISAGALSAYALLADGTVAAWGDNAYGQWEYQAGDEPVRGAPTVPQRVKGLKRVVAIAAGGSGSGYALLADGTVRSWGANQYGQLGNGTEVESHAPVSVKGLTHVVAISAGMQSAYALRSDGSVWGWGYDGADELGVASSRIDLSALTPVRVAKVSDAVAISGGYGSLYILRSDGTVWGTGIPFGAADHSYPPIVPGGPPEVGQVPGLRTVVAIAGGLYDGWALRKDGTVMGWGDNGSGQTGDGTRVDHLSTPVRVKGLTHATALCHDVGWTGCALRDDGTEWIWGDNGRGALGDGTTHSRPTPAPVPGLKGVIALSQGGDSGYAVVRG